MKTDIVRCIFARGLFALALALPPSISAAANSLEIIPITVDDLIILAKDSEPNAFDDAMERIIKFAGLQGDVMLGDGSILHLLNRDPNGSWTVEIEPRIQCFPTNQFAAKTHSQDAFRKGKGIQEAGYPWVTIRMLRNRSGDACNTKYEFVRRPLIWSGSQFKDLGIKDTQKISRVAVNELIKSLSDGDIERAKAILRNPSTETKWDDVAIRWVAEMRLENAGYKAIIIQLHHVIPKGTVCLDTAGLIQDGKGFAYAEPSTWTKIGPSNRAHPRFQQSAMNPGCIERIWSDFYPDRTPAQNDGKDSQSFLPVPQGVHMLIKRHEFKDSRQHQKASGFVSKKSLDVKCTDGTEINVKTTEGLRKNDLLRFEQFKFGNVDVPAESRSELQEWSQKMRSMGGGSVTYSGFCRADRHFIVFNSTSPATYQYSYVVSYDLKAKVIRSGKLGPEIKD